MRNVGPGRSVVPVQAFPNDPKDDHVIECAMAASARIVVSSDKVFGHGDVSAFGIKMMTAREYVYEMETERRMR